MTTGTCDEGPVTKTNVGRLTNGIYVFTLLLLFKNVRIPSFSDIMHDTEIGTFGLMQIPDILSFINAFLIIALFWTITFHIFHQLRKVDMKFLFLHFGLLIFIIFIPVSSHLYQVMNGNSIISIFFHSNILFIGIFLIFEWLHGIHTPGLTGKEICSQKISCISRKMFYVPVSAVIGIMLSLIDIPLTRNIYYVTMLALFLDWTFTKKFLCHQGRGEDDNG
ncbi:MAG: DUF1211 domain-containing protein [Methanomicrobiales archaeon]|jgi:uncharacterized membrane protein|nr:DUF1211 domain-containing protein [Methanomicrobiales archaeon]